MNDMKIAIKQTDDIAWIIEAAVDLSEATDADLQAIKAKKWYNKLLDSITFSKDDQIQIAKDIGSLAKLQEIIIRVLVMLSQENVAISTAVRQQAELLKGLSTKDTALLSALKKIKYGGTTQIDFSDLDREKKVLIASLLTMADPTIQRNDYSKRYIGSILQIANATALDNTVNPAAVDDLNREEQELLYRMIMIDRYLKDMDFEEPSEIVDWISVNPRRKKEIRISIIETACAVTPDFFVTYYEKNTVDIDKVSGEDISFCDIQKEDQCDSGSINNSRSFAVAKKFIDVKKDCAIAVFRAIESLTPDQFIESSSYIVFNDSNKLSYLHKETAIKKTIDVEIGDVKVLFAKRQIAAHHDVLCYLIGNDVFYYDLDSRVNTLAAHLPEVVRDNETVEIRNISFNNSKVIYYCNGLNVYDIESGEQVSVKVPDETFGMGDTSEYILSGENIFFLSDVYTEKKGKDLAGIVLCKYCITNNLATLVSEPFALHEQLDYLNKIVHFGVYNDKICVIVEYTFNMGMDPSGLNCVYIDVNNDRNMCNNFYIWTPFIYSIQQYNNHLVYVNASKDYSVISHDFLTDKNKVMTKNHGYTEKAKFSERLFVGKGFYQHPGRFTLIGKWICYRDKHHNMMIVSAI